MNWTDRIGEYAYFISLDRITKKKVIEGRISYHLNTGSDRHGRLLDPKVEYRVEGFTEFMRSNELFFNKEDIIKDL